MNNRTSPSEPSSPDPILALTSIRFLAAIWVVFHHFGEVLVPSSWTWLEIIRSRGGAGVTMFFVLSGFILSINYAKRGKIGYRDFLAARIARIYPLYSFAAILAIPFFVLSAIDESYPGGGTAYAVTQIILCLALLQAWFPMHASVLNPPGWSLSAEWFFYSMFPAAMNHDTTRKFLSSTLLAVVTLWIASIALSAAAPLAIQPIASALDVQIPKNFILFLTAFNPLIRFPEFLIGCSLGLLHLRKKPFPMPGLVSALTFFGISGILVFLPITPSESILHTSLLSPLFGLFIFALANTEFSSQSLLTSRFMTFLGESSYALYVLHEPIRGWMGWGFDKLHVQFSEEIKVTLVITGCLFISGFAFLWIESPARPRVRAWISGKKPGMPKA